MGSLGLGGPIRLEARGPIVIVTYLGGATDEQYAAYLRELSTVVTGVSKQYPRVSQIHDASAWTKSSASQRQMQADWIKEHLTLLKMKGGYSAYVFKSALVRGGLTAVMWLVEMPGPYKVCSTLQEALDWSTRQVSETTSALR